MFTTNEYEKCLYLKFLDFFVWIFYILYDKVDPSLKEPFGGMVQKSRTAYSVEGEVQIYVKKSAKCYFDKKQKTFSQNHIIKFCLEIYLQKQSL